MATLKYKLSKKNQYFHPNLRTLGNCLTDFQSNIKLNKVMVIYSFGHSLINPFHDKVKEKNDNIQTVTLFLFYSIEFPKQSRKTEESGCRPLSSASGKKLFRLRTIASRPIFVFRPRIFY